MLNRILLTALIPLISVGAWLGQTSEADASDRERRFFKSVEGKWSGPGEIVNGKYKGWKFVCNFNGSAPENGLGMTLDGNCRVGLFSRDMSASITKQGRRYRGQFDDGAAGKGLDVVNGTVDANRVTVRLEREKISGAMQARMMDENTMNVTVLVDYDNQLVPVLGVSLKRLDRRSVGSIAER